MPILNIRDGEIRTCSASAEAATALFRRTAMSAFGTPRPIDGGKRERRSGSSSRLIALDEHGVTFRYRDYRRNGQARYRTMTLGAGEFIRRFLLHVLPKGFHRIRHYGLLASASCKANIARARELIAAPLSPVDPPQARDAADPHVATDHRPPCPCCGGRMIIVEVFAPGGAPRGPPSGAAIRS